MPDDLSPGSVLRGDAARGYVSRSPVSELEAGSLRVKRSSGRSAMIRPLRPRLRCRATSRPSARRSRQSPADNRLSARWRRSKPSRRTLPRSSSQFSSGAMDGVRQAGHRGQDDSGGPPERQGRFPQRRAWQRCSSVARTRGFIPVPVVPGLLLKRLARRRLPAHRPCRADHRDQGRGHPQAPRQPASEGRRPGRIVPTWRSASRKRPSKTSTSRANTPAPGKRRRRHPDLTAWLRKTSPRNWLF